MIRLGRPYGQTSVEQAILFMIAAMVLVGMYRFMTSALAHRAKAGADGLGHGALYRAP